MIISFISFSQNNINLVVFSEDGDPFFAYVNGIQQNSKPESNVKITGVSPNVSLRIEFENKAYPQLKQNMPLEGGLEHTFRIKKDMKQQMKLRYFGSVPLSEASTGVATVAYHTAPVTEVAVESDNNSSVNTTVNSTTFTTKTTTKPVTKKSDDVSVNINMGSVGINMNVNGMGVMEAEDVHATTSTTTTTSSSSTYNTPKSNNTVNSTNTTNNTTITKVGCSMAMSQASFDKMKQSVESKPFSETKMSTAKVATKSACLSVNQVKEICKLFSMDEDKLEYAKFAKPYCVNAAEYYQVSDVFSFSGTIEDFNKFLEQ